MLLMMATFLTISLLILDEVLLIVESARIQKTQGCYGAPFFVG